MSKKKEDKKYEELEQKSAEYLAGWKRAQADYQNLKKEHSEQLGKISELSAVKFVEPLLPVIDHYEMAINHVPKDVADESWMQGFFFIKKQFDAFLEETGIKKIETLGKEFNPHKHEALEHRESEEAEGTIIEEKQAGYEIKDTVIRPAKVVVAKSGKQ